MNKKTIIIQLAIFAVIAVVLIVLGTTRGSSSSSEEKKQSKVADKVEVYYFYGTQRCVACVTLEEFTEETINENFQEELRDGKIKFESVNVDLAENRGVVDKYQARGSALYINSIYDNEDHIREEVNVWRYLNNKEQFKNYLSNKIKSNFE